jgi:hypothetical protein
MTNDQNEEMDTHLGADDYFEKNKALFANNPAFKKAIEEFRANYKAETQFGALLATDNTVFSQEKLNLKTKMINDIVELAGFAYVALTVAGKIKEADQLDIHPSDYALSDQDSYDLAKANLKLMRDQIVIIAPDYVTDIELTELETTIESFINAKGDAMVINKATPAQREAFRLALEKTRISINHIRILAKKYKKTNPIVYDQIIKVTTVNKTRTNHTSLSMGINDKDGKPIVGATASLSTSKKTATSDLDGNLKIDAIRNGQTMATIQAPGFKDKQIKLNIVRGRENHLEVVVE